MRIPLARYGFRELLLGTVLCGGLGLVSLLFFQAAALLLWPSLFLVVGVWVFLLSFFRDPERPCPGGERDVLSPADGTIAEVSEVENPPYMDGPAVKIGIFMSIFNCHVNRAPVSGTVRYLESRLGAFYDARKPESAEENTRREVGLERQDGSRVLVNLIVGAVARRIVCAVQEGDRLDRGQRLGMIKFGSRVEAYLPRDMVEDIRVEKDMTVKAGLTVLARLESNETAESTGCRPTSRNPEIFHERDT